jgi:hypothetical protein
MNNDLLKSVVIPIGVAIGLSILAVLIAVFVGFALV